MDNFNFSKLLAPSIIFAVCCCLLILLMILKKKIRKKHGDSDVFVSSVRAPLQVFLILTALYVIFETLKYHWTLNPIVEQVYSILAIICLGWLAIKVINVISSLLLYHFNLQEKDNNRARQIHTQVRIFQRLFVAFIVFLIIAGILITFESVRAQGVNLLASAGIISIIIGFAAQKTLGNFFAGIQIAIAQPIRVDDVVVVENEWGRIEEIHLTFVIVKLWDLRRLIVPINYFTDNIFQNWTQKTADILGVVFIYVDYTMPIKLIREELDRILQGNSLWDGKVKVVQVTDTTEHTMEVRILASALNSAAAFDLRCAIREHMIAFIQKNYPTSLPRLRTEISRDVKIKIHESPDIPKELVRAPAPTLDPHPMPKNQT